MPSFFFFLAVDPLIVNEMLRTQCSRKRNSARGRCQETAVPERQTVT